MKKRLQFVSNSSSSSFVIISHREPQLPTPLYTDKLIVDGRNAETVEFGWGPDTINCRESRLVFAWLQASYLSRVWNPDLKKYEYGRSAEMHMLEEVLKEVYQVEEVEWRLSTEFCWKEEDRDPEITYGCYIDHQSSASEGENLEIFNDEDTLRQFLFSPGSCIELDNDNRY